MGEIKGTMRAREGHMKDQGQFPRENDNQLQT